MRESRVVPSKGTPEGKGVTSPKKMLAMKAQVADSGKASPIQDVQNKHKKKESPEKKNPSETKKTNEQPTKNFTRPTNNFKEKKTPNKNNGEGRTAIVQGTGVPLDAIRS